MPPWPVPEALNLPGLALIAATRSLTFLYGASARTCDAGRIGVDQADRRVRRAGEVGQALPVHHADLDRDQADRVAVGRRGRDRRVADDAAAAGAVDDVDRLARAPSRAAMPMMRAVASVPPPAPHGTISVIGRSGHAAWALPKPTVAAIATAARTVLLLKFARTLMGSS